MTHARTTGLAAIAALVLGTALPGAASAQSTWNMVSGSGCTQNAGNTGNYGNSWACTSGGNAGTTVTASAYASQAGSGGTLQSVSGSQYANAYMSAQGANGFGAANRSEGLGAITPDSAFDNMTTAGSFDMLVLNFDTSVVLNQIALGWTYFANGADISVFRWTGAGAPDSGTASATAGGNKALSTTGWTLVNSLADVTAGTSRSTGATSGSSWWMVSAYNSTLNTGSGCLTLAGGTVGKNTSGKCDDGDDGFMLNFLQTTVPANDGSGGTTPEPATLALVTGALLAAGVARRRAGRPG